VLPPQSSKTELPIGIPTGPNPISESESLPPHLSATLVSHFPEPDGDAVILDFGCGDSKHREFCENRGFEWCGFDIDSPQASVVGDGHLLPFSDDSFQFIITTAVFEHIKNPFVAAKELFRVLEPGGRLIGSAAFLEPFHGASQFHMSHHGIHTVFTEAGFHVDYLGPYDIINLLPGVGWEAPITLSRRLFPGLPLGVRTGIVLPLRLLSLLYYRIGSFITSDREYDAVDMDRSLSLAGQIGFVISKPIDN
jgi:SAM-dependent methyltransferase